MEESREEKEEEGGGIGWKVEFGEKGRRVKKRNQKTRKEIEGGEGGGNKEKEGIEGGRGEKTGRRRRESERNQ